MSEIRQKLIAKKIHMRSHLDELRVLLGRAVAAEELCSLEQTESIRQASRKFRDQPVTACEIDFAAKQSDRFRSFVDRLAVANASPIYLWATYSVECGTLMVRSLRDVKFDFDFAVGEMDLLSVTTSDLQDRLLLDWFESDAGARRLKIETQGKHWAGMSF